MANLTSAPDQNEQREVPLAHPVAPPAVAAATGQRSAFKDLPLQLTPEELANPGTQKCILDMLLRAEDERNDLKEYVSKFYLADKKAEVLNEKLKSNKINETLFGVGVAVGGTVMGLTPFFYEKGTAYGIIALGVGVALTLGATIGRILYK